jgi:hypothetical protein
MTASAVVEVMVPSSLLVLRDANFFAALFLSEVVWSNDMPVKLAGDEALS